MKFKYEATVILIGAIAMAFILGAATQERIRWKWHDRTIYELSDFNGASLMLGLRNDGVVVWREIMPATTNSPAEQAETMTILNGLTNFIWKPDWTNILIQPLYVPPRDHPEWTNWEEGARWWSNQIWVGFPADIVIRTNWIYPGNWPNDEDWNLNPNHNIITN